tara:strand:- start:1774 stop:1935 length:162 start_codon:yes stop_codon:yes gene_type:complete
MNNFAQGIIDMIGFMLTLSVTIILWFIIIAIGIIVLHIIRDYYYKAENGKKSC